MIVSVVRAAKPGVPGVGRGGDKLEGVIHEGDAIHGYGGEAGR